MLSLPEEIVLLTLDDATGRAIGRQGIATSIALAGAVLMELALAGRVDTDRHRLEVLDDTPTGDVVLDAGLPLLRNAPDSRGALMLLAREETGLRPAVLAALMARGLLQRVDGRVLLVFPERRYLKPEDRPEPREALLLGLARATALLPLLMPPELLAARQERIALLGRIEALNRSVAETVGDLYLHRLRAV